MGDKLFALLIVVIISGAVAFMLVGDTSRTEEVGDIEGVVAYSDLSRGHVEGVVEYETNPPVGGDHNPLPADCNATVYKQQILNENAVHSLEHGAVWVTYNEELRQADVEFLEDKVSQLPYSFMSPNPTQSSPLTLTAWGLQLELNSAHDVRVDQFLGKYRQGPQTPEPGATCSNPAV